jgi:hypothetical protein
MFQRLRTMIERAVQRGEVSADIDRRLLADVLFGAVTNHVVSTPRELQDKMEAQLDPFIAGLVDLVMNGIKHGAWRSAR